ncbi:MULTISPECIES: DUF3574 domain-containing protein [Pantoea]|uniref:DUF3574 domain-containing protein n=2 Tax=Pantoea TaxID=53335 RepID=A0A0U3TH92_9GAMM|nr:MULTISPECIES: DUF3574 domain-containing protein [Pantoea]ALV94165.1 hypothetical protein LK04_19320 [Pantoea vagans]KHJ69615.1 hypothetical protein QU24_02585 [Pantoea rodasii]
MLNKLAIPLVLVLSLAGCQAPSTSHEQIPPNTAPVAVCGSGDIMMQTTLWFGMNKPKGGTVSSSEWQQFVDNDVTPRFKDGLSVYDGKGQWLGEGGKLARENSKALMLIHQPDRSSSESINTLRDIYKKRFDQESVMRVDALVCVAF